MAADKLAGRKQRALCFASTIDLDEAKDLDEVFNAIVRDLRAAPVDQAGVVVSLNVHVLSSRFACRSCECNDPSHAWDAVAHPKGVREVMSRIDLPHSAINVSTQTVEQAVAANASVVSVFVPRRSEESTFEEAAARAHEIGRLITDNLRTLDKSLTNTILTFGRVRLVCAFGTRVVDLAINEDERKLAIQQWIDKYPRQE